MNKNEKLLSALIAVVTVSVTAAFGPALLKADTGGNSVSSLLDGGLFTVLHHQEEAQGHKGALILSIATKDDKSAHALAFMQTNGEHAGKGMACGVAKESESHDLLRCVADQGANDLIEVLTVADLNTDFCEHLRTELEKPESPDYVNPIMKLEDCKVESCICYRIEHLNIGQEEPGPNETTLARNPPGRGSGSGGTD